MTSTAFSARAGEEAEPWAPPHCDVPRRGLPLTALVETAARPHRSLLSAMSASGEASIAEAVRLIMECRDVAQASRLIAGIVAIRVASLGQPTTVHDALEWFSGERIGAQPGILSLEWGPTRDENLTGLLPYVLDPFGLTTRRSLLSGRGSARERTARKGLGTFYTPGDVARGLAAEVITTSTRGVLDPACGAGVFLRAAFSELSTQRPAHQAVRSLVGVDIDPLAIDACALVLTHDWLRREALAAGESPGERFAVVRRQLTCGNALDLFAESAQDPLFGSATAGVGHHSLPPAIDAVLMNPPFASARALVSKTRASYASLSAAPRSSSSNLAWPFWELVARATSWTGRAGVVLPLSIAYRNDPAARAARRAAFATGSWEFRFFDRTPDAIFGDDIKQRIAIGIKRPGPVGHIRTHSLRRWSADRRDAALRFEPAEGTSYRATDGPMLKIGSDLERAALERLQKGGATLGERVRAARLVAPAELTDTGREIIIAPTAYNWIGVFRGSAAALEARRAAAGKVAQLLFPTKAMADAAYGVIASRVFLWWWRVTGDLFHVPLRVLTGAPFDLGRPAEHELRTLAEAGRRCWAAAFADPIVSINRGVRTVAYAASDAAALDTVDTAVCLAFGLDREFVRFVREDSERLRIAGRSG